MPMTRKHFSEPLDDLGKAEVCELHVTWHFQLPSSKSKVDRLSFFFQEHCKPNEIFAKDRKLLQERAGSLRNSPAIRVDQDILRLQVTVDDIELMAVPGRLHVQANVLKIR